MLIAQPVVHTTGINWDSLGVIIAAITGGFAVCTWFITKRSREQKDATASTEKAITSAVGALRTVLLEKLETKENVAALRVEMARQNARLEMVIGIITSEGDRWSTRRTRNWLRSQAAARSD